MLQILKSKNLFAVLFGFLIVFFFLAVIQIIFGKMTQSSVRHKVCRPSIFHTNDLGLVEIKEGSYHCSYEYKGETYFEGQINFDKYGRRVSSVGDQEERNQFAIFMGDSMTMGEGVYDHETLPSQVGIKTKTLIPYNYGINGRGPNEMLAILQTRNIKEEIEEDNGILIFSLFDGHVSRVNGFMYVMRWLSDGPYYVRNEDGKIVRKGTLTTGRPWGRVLRILSKIAILQHFGINIPREMTKEHVILTMEVLSEIRREFLKIYPESKMYILLYPMNQYNEELITEGLGNFNFDVIRVPETMEDKEGTNIDERYRVKDDWLHPNGWGYSLIAEHLITELNLN